MTTDPTPCVAIIGCGTVGGAYRRLFEDAGFDVLALDARPDFNPAVTYELIATRGPDVVFVCVPTPMNVEARPGDIDCSAVYDVLSNLARFPEFQDTNGPVVCIKSTVTPMHLVRMRHSFGLRLTFSPEYLRENHADDDLRAEDKLIVGGERRDTRVVHAAVEEAYAGSRYEQNTGQAGLKQVHHLDLLSACIVKYMENCYLAMKVAFCNQFQRLHEAMCHQYQPEPHASWDDVARAWMADTRIGETHWQVPGPDGDYGFGGKCLPKDVNAIIREAAMVSEPLTIMETVLRANDAVRSSIDWFALPASCRGHFHE